MSLRNSEIKPHCGISFSYKCDAIRYGRINVASYGRSHLVLSSAVIEYKVILVNADNFQMGWVVNENSDGTACYECASGHSECLSIGKHVNGIAYGQDGCIHTHSRPYDTGVPLQEGDVITTRKYENSIGEFKVKFYVNGVETQQPNLGSFYVHPKAVPAFCGIGRFTVCDQVYKKSTEET